MSFTKLASKQTLTNYTQGDYRPCFFDNPNNNLASVDFSTRFFSSEDAEYTLLNDEFSFAYLREDKLRIIKATDSNNRLIAFDKFLDFFSLSIESTNIFKTGKYISRVFRPTRFGGFYKNLAVEINASIPIKKVDGLSIISVELAKSLGFTSAIPNMSAQFTMFFDGGLVKGHCVFSDSINADVIIYGLENIKTEIRFNSDLYYLAIEPVKLSPNLRLDIQSMLNLWELFGQEQFFSWAVRGVNQFRQDLMGGDLNNRLDDFDDIYPIEYENESWTLKKTLWHKIDYRCFPGLVRQAWSLYRKSIINYADNSKGMPVFRIPVPGGMRGYFRIDIRNHNCYGDLHSTTCSTEVEVDRFGNIWINPSIIEEFLAIKGGADLDDSAGIIPLDNGKAVIYRNPNQYGEYGIHTINYIDCSPSSVNSIVGSIPLKKREPEESTSLLLSGNKLYDRFFMDNIIQKHVFPYTRENLIRTYVKIATNSANVGLAANAEMIRSSIGITEKNLMNNMIAQYNWNLERVIDSTVKEGLSCENDMKAVNDMTFFVVEQKIPIAKSIKHRFPEKMIAHLNSSDYHPLDELFEAINLLIRKADLDILGSGSVSKGNRIKGFIDNLEVPIVAIGLSNISNTMTDAAINLYKDYNRSIAIMMDETKNLPEWEREIKRRQSIEIIQNNLIAAFGDYSESEKREIVKCWAYEIYRGDRAVHDSILWMNGVADYTIKMLADVGIAYHVKHNGSIKRFHEVKTDHYKATLVRLWSKEELCASSFLNEASVLICDGKALLGAKELFIGDECLISDGVYNISKVVQAVSRKSRGMLLRNSVTLYLD